MNFFIKKFESCTRYQTTHASEPLSLPYRSLVQAATPANSSILGVANFLMQAHLTSCLSCTLPWNIVAPTHATW